MNRKGQHILEFVVLFCVILSALLIMQYFIKRGYQGRIKQDVDSIGAAQYAPGHSTSQYITTIDTNTTTYVGGKTPTDQVVEPGMTVTIGQVETTVDKEERVDSFRSKSGQPAIED
ncbi:hypothetical protein D4R78_03030 [bacterium]|nr:MAG: hypothetical protein D4R78_03030 [bacterium]